MFATQRNKKFNQIQGNELTKDISRRVRKDYGKKSLRKGTTGWGHILLTNSFGYCKKIVKKQHYRLFRRSCQVEESFISRTGSLSEAGLIPLPVSNEESFNHEEDDQVNSESSEHQRYGGNVSGNISPSYEESLIYRDNDHPDSESSEQERTRENNFNNLIQTRQHERDCSDSDKVQFPDNTLDPDSGVTGVGHAAAAVKGQLHRNQIIHKRDLPDPDGSCKLRDEGLDPDGHVYAAAQATVAADSQSRFNHQFIQERQKSEPDGSFQVRDGNLDPDGHVYYGNLDPEGDVCGEAENTAIEDSLPHLNQMHQERQMRDPDNAFQVRGGNLEPNGNLYCQTQEIVTGNGPLHLNQTYQVCHIASPCDSLQVRDGNMVPALAQDTTAGFQECRTPGPVESIESALDPDGDIPDHNYSYKIRDVAMDPDADFYNKSRNTAADGQSHLYQMCQEAFQVDDGRLEPEGDVYCEAQNSAAANGQSHLNQIFQEHHMPDPDESFQINEGDLDPENYVYGDFQDNATENGQSHLSRISEELQSHDLNDSFQELDRGFDPDGDVYSGAQHAVAADEQSHLNQICEECCTPDCDDPFQEDDSDLDPDGDVYNGGQHAVISKDERSPLNWISEECQMPDPDDSFQEHNLDLDPDGDIIGEAQYTTAFDRQTDPDDTFEVRNGYLDPVGNINCEAQDSILEDSQSHLNQIVQERQIPFPGISVKVSACDDGAYCEAQNTSIMKSQSSFERFFQERQTPDPDGCFLHINDFALDSDGDVCDKAFDATVSRGQFYLNQDFQEYHSSDCDGSLSQDYNQPIATPSDISVSGGNEVVFSKREAAERFFEDFENSNNDQIVYMMRSQSWRLNKERIAIPEESVEPIYADAVAVQGLEDNVAGLLDSARPVYQERNVRFIKPELATSEVVSQDSNGSTTEEGTFSRLQRSRFPGSRFLWIFLRLRALYRGRARVYRFGNYEHRGLRPLQYRRHQRRSSGSVIVPSSIVVDVWPMQEDVAALLEQQLSRIDRLQRFVREGSFRSIRRGSFRRSEAGSKRSWNLFRRVTSKNEVEPRQWAVDRLAMLAEMNILNSVAYLEDTLSSNTDLSTTTNNCGQSICFDGILFRYKNLVKIQNRIRAWVCQNQFDHWKNAARIIQARYRRLKFAYMTKSCHAHFDFSKYRESKERIIRWIKNVSSCYQNLCSTGVVISFQRFLIGYDSGKPSSCFDHELDVTNSVRNIVHELKEKKRPIIFFDELYGRLGCCKSRESLLECLKQLASCGEVVYIGNKASEALSKVIVISKNWISQIFTHMLRKDFFKGVESTKKFLRLQSEQTMPVSEKWTDHISRDTFPVVCCHDVRQDWLSLRSIRKALFPSLNQDPVHNQNVELTLFDFLEALMVKTRVFVPCSSSEYFSSSALHSSTKTLAKYLLFFLPDHLELSDTDSWVYKTAWYKPLRSWEATVCLSWNFSGHFSNSTWGQLLARTVGSFFETLLNVRDIQCWKDAMAIVIGSTEIFLRFESIRGCKRIFACGRGADRFSGKIIWKDGGFQTVVDTINSELSQLDAENDVICPVCLECGDLYTASKRNYNYVATTAKLHCSRARCKKGHQFDTQLLSGYFFCDENDLHPTASCLCLSLKSLYPAVVQILVWDDFRNQVTSRGSGFIVDKKRGLVVTAAHVIYYTKNGDGLFGRLRGTRIFIGIITDENIASFRYFAVAVAQDIRNVDACILHLRTRLKKDVNVIDDLASIQDMGRLLHIDDAILNENLQSLPMTENFILEEQVRVFGFNQREDAVKDGISDVSHGNIRIFCSVNVCKGYVCRYYDESAVNSSSSSSSTTTTTTVGFVARKELVIACFTLNGDSGGPCVNNHGQVIGILSCGHDNRSYLVPSCEIKLLVQSCAF